METGTLSLSEILKKMQNTTCYFVY